MRVRDLQKAVHEWSHSKGWLETFETVKRASGGEDFRILAALIAEKLALVHTEVSEAVEVLRDTETLEQLALTTHTGENFKPEGFGPELADIVIRVVDLAAMVGIDLQTELLLKIKYNDTRPYKHGKKGGM